jgi:RNA:NAD 2'-phosphotransferase (TPT1/KptA family)
MGTHQQIPEQASAPPAATPRAASRARWMGGCQYVAQGVRTARLSHFARGARSGRANQGHSVEVDLELAPAVPPAVLYHGTGHKTADIIRQTGLGKMSRHHVHLSSDRQTATKVGARHGRPVVFEVDATAMHRDGHIFYVSANGVWLVDAGS